MCGDDRREMRAEVVPNPCDENFVKPAASINIGLVYLLLHKQKDLFRFSKAFKCKRVF